MGVVIGHDARHGSHRFIVNLLVYWIYAKSYFSGIFAGGNTGQNRSR